MPQEHPAPTTVLDWGAYENWRETVWSLVDDVLDARVVAEFRRRPPEYVVGDDLSWLDTIVRRATGRELDTKALMADRLMGHYSAMRACHATRTADIASYYAHGLRPLTPAHVHARAKEIFLSGEFPELSDADLETAFVEVGCDLREGRVFFEANERLLLNLAGHYLHYGGEYLIAIAAHLPGHRDYRQVLKQFGKPTMFICDVPLEDIGGRIVLEFAGTALESLFEEILQGDEFEPDRHRGAGFPIYKALPPEQIVGHYHPSEMRDPFRRY